MRVIGQVGRYPRRKHTASERILVFVSPRGWANTRPTRWDLIGEAEEIRISDLGTRTLFYDGSVRLTGTEGSYFSPGTLCGIRFSWFRPSPLLPQEGANLFLAAHCDFSLHLFLPGVVIQHWYKPVIYSIGPLSLTFLTDPARRGSGTAGAFEWLDSK